MGQEVRRRKQNTVEYSTNNKVTEGLGRGMVYREIYLRLQGAATVAGAAALPANVQRGDEWGVVKNIELRANGTDVIKSMDGNALWWLNLFLFGTPPRVSPVLGDGATANGAFDSLLILPLWYPRSVRPIDTALDARELSSLELQITWGTFTDINSAASAWTTEPTIEIYSAESFNIDGPFAQWRTFKIEKDITASNPRFEVILPVGRGIRGFLINTTDAGVDQSDILNNFKLVSGGNTFADISAGDDVLQQIEMLRNGIPRGFSGVAYDDYRIGDDNNLDGWYWYDHVMDGRMTEMIDTLGLSEFKIEADVTVGAGATKLIVYPMEIIPVRNRAAA